MGYDDFKIGKENLVEEVGGNFGGTIGRQGDLALSCINSINVVVT